jgi:hypothetical protein
MAKTLIGKEGYLFLTNDGNREIEKHCSKEYACNTDVVNMYSKLENFLLVVFPDKSYVLPQYLPDGFNPIYRPVFDHYRKALGDRIVDGYDIIKDTPEIFYKVDSHMNTKGCIMILNAAIGRLNSLFGYILATVNCQLKRVECEPFEGDLTIPINLGGQQLESKRDVHYYADEYIYIRSLKVTGTPFRILTKTLEDCTVKLLGQQITWEIISEYIFYQKNADKTGKVVVFCDSFTIPNMCYILSMFNEVYLIKDKFRTKLVEMIAPTHIIEMRIERFLL